MAEPRASHPPTVTQVTAASSPPSLGWWQRAHWIERARKRGLGRRWLYVAIIVLLAWWPLYLLAANIAINTRLIPALVNANPAVRLEYSSAVSWLPGHVRVNDFRLRIDDANVQALLMLDRADVTVALGDLAFRRTFHAEKVRAQGAKFLFRFKVDKADAHNGLRVASYPRIPGLPVLPLRSPGAPPPPGMSTVRDNLWTIHLEDVEARTDELWIQEYRYRGAGVARGSFRLEPTKRLQVGLSTFDVEGGSVAVEPRVIATDTRGRVEVTIGDFDIPGNPGLTALHFVDAKVLLNGNLTDLGVLNVYLTDVGEAERVIQGKGPFAIDLQFDRGPIAKGSHVTLDASDVVGHVGPFAMRGPLSVAISAPETGALVLGFDSAELAASASRGRTEIGTLSGTTLRAKLDAHDLADGVRIEGAELHGRAAVPDLAVLGRVLQSKLLAGGRGTASVDVALAAKALTTQAATTLDALELELGNGTRVHGDVRASVAATSDERYEKIAVADGRLDAPNVTFAHAGKAKTTWLTMRGARGRIVPERECADVTGDVTLGHAGALAVAIGGGGGILEGFIVEWLKNATVAAHMRGRVTADGSAVDVERATVGPVVARGTVVKGSGPPSAAFVAEADGLSAGIDLRGGETKVKPLAGFDWVNERSAELHHALGTTEACR